MFECLEHEDRRRQFLDTLPGCLQRWFGWGGGWGWKIFSTSIPVTLCVREEICASCMLVLSREGSKGNGLSTLILQIVLQPPHVYADIFG